MRGHSQERPEPPERSHGPKPRAGADPGELRLTAGEFRTRIIECPQTGDVRPMLSKTRQALFNVLADDIKGAKIWDCFAGSGLLGFEALSRGAAHCTFIENNYRHADAIARNIKSLKLEKRTALLRGDTFRIVRSGAPKLGNTPADFIFLDPPHAIADDLEKGPFWPWLMTLHQSQIVDGYTVVVIGHHSRLQIPEEVGGYMVVDRREYGSVGFSILVNSEKPDDENAE